MAAGEGLITGVDFVAVPTQDLERAVEFYGTTLGLPRSVYRPERNFAEFETGTVTLSVSTRRGWASSTTPTATRSRCTSTTSPPRARRSRSAA